MGGGDDKFGGRARGLAESSEEQAREASEKRHLVDEVETAHERDALERGEAPKRPWWRFWRR